MANVSQMDNGLKNADDLLRGIFSHMGNVGWNALARRLGVNPYRLRGWRKGTIPDSTNLFILLTLADKLGLRGILMCPKKDMCDQAESQYLEQTTG